MNVYSVKIRNSQKNNNNLIILLTTTQSPHLEASFAFLENNLNCYKNIFLIDFISCVSYRNEYTWRTCVPFSTNIIRKIRNGLFKKLYISAIIKKFGFKKEFIHISGQSLINTKDIFLIMKTYSMTEFSSAAFTSTPYKNEIIDSILKVSSGLNNFCKKYKIKSTDTFLLFNGRHPLEFTSRMTLSKLKFNKIVYHECNNNVYKVFYTDFQIHNLSAYHKLIYQYKQNNTNLVNTWLTQKNLNLNSNYKKKYVTYFTSSFDEYAFAYSNPINQSLIIFALINNKASLPLKIRVHPNTKNKSLRDRNFWDFLKLKYPKIIINYDENVCSYKLIKQSFFTISIGSSIAPESLILGTNHLLCGNQHMYTKLPGFYKSKENNLVALTNFMYKKRFKLRPVSKNEKEYAAASQLFNKEMGEVVKLAFMGKYPFRLGVRKF